MHLFVANGVSYMHSGLTEDAMIKDEFKEHCHSVLLVEGPITGRPGRSHAPVPLRQEAPRRPSSRGNILSKDAPHSQSS